MTIQQNYPAIKPTLNLDFANTKQLDPRITYSRASTGTYYDGKTVAKAEENLLTQSGNVAVWTQILGVSRTANATVAPDGTTTAGLVTVDSSTGRHIVGSNRGGVAPIGSTITGSVFLKASTYGFASVQLSNDTISVNAGRYSISVDLSNGTVGGFTGNVGVSGQTASVVSAGNGWYRVILTMTTTVAGAGDGLNIIVTPMPTNGSTYPDGAALLPSFTGDGTSGIFVWGAQLELRSSATAYTPTTTAPITNYIPVLQTASAGTPRFGHNPITGESLGLLIEEQRTNLLTYSEGFDTAAWTKSNATVTANTIVAPDGTLTGDKLVENTANSDHRVGQPSGVVGGSETLSVYAKAAERSWMVFQLGSNSVAYFNLANGTLGNVTGGTATITAVGNGWYRCSITGIRATNLNNLIFMTTGNGVATYTGDGFSGIYIWGAQLEAGAFATSYIPTVASQVTRAADSASMTGTNFSSWYNPSEGSLYNEATPSVLGSYRISSVNDGTSSNRVLLNASVSTGNAIVITAGTQVADLFSGATAVGSLIKQAFAYKVNDFAFSGSGAAVATDSLGGVPLVNVMNIGAGHANTGILNGTIKKIAYYPRRLTNTQLQALTT